MRKLVHLDDDLRLELRMVLVEDLMEALRLQQLHCLTLFTRFCDFITLSVEHVSSNNHVSGIPIPSFWLKIIPY